MRWEVEWRPETFEDAPRLCLWECIVRECRRRDNESFFLVEVVVGASSVRESAREMGLPKSARRQQMAAEPGVESASAGVEAQTEIGWQLLACRMGKSPQSRRRRCRDRAFW